MRRALACLIALGVLVVPAVPASADVTAEFALGILTVRGDAEGNGIVVECVNGNVRVNEAPPSGGRVRCRNVESILVRAGGGPDRVELADIGRTAFEILLEIGLFGQAGNDTLLGSALADRLEGGSGVDTLRGARGADTLIPGGGGGALVGGEARDRAIVSGDGDWEIADDRIVRRLAAEERTSLRGIDAVTVNARGGDDDVVAAAFSGRLRIDGGSGDDRIRGGSGRDRLLGDAGRDELHAGDGNDIVAGGGDGDALRGGGGDDQLRGGAGDDACAGGPGADSLLSC